MAKDAIREVAGISAVQKAALDELLLRTLSLEANAEEAVESAVEKAAKQAAFKKAMAQKRATIESAVNNALAVGYIAEEMAAVETHIKEAAPSIVPEMDAVGVCPKEATVVPKTMVEKVPEATMEVVPKTALEVVQNLWWR